MTALTRFPSLLLLLALAALTLSGCRPPRDGAGNRHSTEANDPTADIKRDEPYLTPVYTLAARRGAITSTISTTGSVVPIRSHAVRTEEAGILRLERDWREGDTVAKDTLIARIESPTLQRELSLGEADVQLQEEALEFGERALRQRRRDYLTLQDLYARGIAALKEVDAARLELERAENQQRQNAINLEKARTRLDELRQRLERLEMRAPYDGVLVSRTTLEGTGRFTSGFGNEAITDHDGRQVSAGHLLCGVVDISSVHMRCDVTSKDIGQIAPGQEAEVTIYSTQNIARTGRIVRISNSVNPETRAFDVDILLENQTGEIKPGMFGRSEVVIERRTDRLVLPRTALARRNNQNVVFLVERPVDAKYEVARLVPIEIGLEGRDEVEIAFGIKTGDQVVVRGHEVLQDNTAVRPIDIEQPIRPTVPAGTADANAGENGD